MAETELTTTTAIEAVAWERAPRYPGRTVNRRIVCADGFAVSVQASAMHYANDSHPSGEAAYLRGPDPDVAYPFTTFEVGNPSADVPTLAEWDADGVWAWVPRDAVAALLDEHGGAVAWETTTPPAPESASEGAARDREALREPAARSVDDEGGWVEAMHQQQRVERALLLAASWDREADRCGRSLSELMLRDAAKQLRAAVGE